MLSDAPVAHESIELIDHAVAAPTQLPLLRRFPRLAERVGRIPMGDWPTPVRRLWRFGGMLGAPNLWIKREDLSASGYGGNKLRGLEFLLADARAKGATEVLTFGAVGSFHVRATAVAARRAGVHTTAVLVHQPRAEYVRRNITTAIRYGARLVPARLPFLPLRFAIEYMRHYPDSGRGPYLIPPGGTSPLACLGHVNAAMELVEQINAGHMPPPDYIFVPLGSLGTAAGLTIGCALAGLRARVVGVVVFHPLYCTVRRWAQLARQTHSLMRRHDPTVPTVPVSSTRLIALTDALGKGYAHFTQGSVRLARQLLRTEGIPLDGTYTAKMYTAALSFLGRRRALDRTALLWHTYCPGPEEIPLSTAEIRRLPAGLRDYFRQRVQPLDDVLSA